jgi:hypothetical protein
MPDIGYLPCFSSLINRYLKIPQGGIFLLEFLLDQAYIVQCNSFSVKVAVLRE